jgi:hypothetical protein
LLLKAAYKNQSEYYKIHMIKLKFIVMEHDLISCS